MQCTRPVRTSEPKARGGFSLIELIVVVLIIGILMALLFPAINGARLAARNAQVTVDIKNLEAAIANFKLKYGVEPPSFVILYEQGSNGSGAVNWGADAVNGSSALNATANRLASQQAIKQIWPSFDFNDMGDVTNHGIDLNGDGSISGSYVLCGAECLVFFLGGPGVLLKNSPVVTGFAASPTSPFTVLSTGARVGPFFEFDAARFTDIDVDGVREYADPLPGQTMPYQYFSSYAGRGYQVLGSDRIPGTADDEALQISNAVTMHSAYYKTDAAWPDNQGSYTVAAGNIPSLTPPVAVTSPIVRGEYWNSRSFQIISPGFDTQYGGVNGAIATPIGSGTASNAGGGLFRNNNPIPVWSAATDTFRSRTARSPETDNITNFSGGPFSSANQLSDYVWNRE